MYQWNRY